MNEKQKIEYILDDKKIDNNNIPYTLVQQPQTPPHSHVNNNPPTENEILYTKRICSLMTLVSKQTKEIQSLRSIIDAYSQNENHSCINCSNNNNNNPNKKRAKH
jgi:hypothetical protein